MADTWRTLADPSGRQGIGKTGTGPETGRDLGTETGAIGIPALDDLKVDIENYLMDDLIQLPDG